MIWHDYGRTFSDTVFLPPELMFDEAEVVAQRIQVTDSDEVILFESYELFIRENYEKGPKTPNWQVWLKKPM